MDQAHSLQGMIIGMADSHNQIILTLGIASPDIKQHQNDRIYKINDWYLHGGNFETESAIKALASLPQPWTLFDPFFDRTLPDWLEALEPYQPKLIYLTKPPKTVKAEYEQAGVKYCRKASGRCNKIHAQWPWEKEARPANSHHCETKIETSPQYHPQIN